MNLNKKINNYQAMVDKLQAREIFKNFLILFSGSTIAQGLGLLISPVLSRLFNEEAFALLGIFNSMVAIIGSFSSGKYEMAILLPKREKNATNIFILSILVSFISFVIFTFLFVIFQDYVLKLVDAPLMKKFVLFVPLASFFFTISLIFTNHLNRLKRYKGITQLNVLKSLTYVVSALVVGYAIEATTYGLIVGKTVSYGITILIVILLIYNRDIKKIINQMEVRRLCYVMKKYNNFPKFVSIHSFVNTCGGQLPILILSYFFLKKELGLYVFSKQIILFPISQIGVAINQVLYQKMSRNFIEKKSNILILKKFILVLFLICVIPLVVMWGWGPKLFSVVFGEKWMSAGEYAKIISLWGVLILISFPFTCVPLIYHQQKQNMYIEFIYTFCKITILILGGLFFSFYSTLIVFCANNLLFLSCRLLWYYQIVKTFESNSTNQKNHEV